MPNNHDRATFAAELQYVKLQGLAEQASRNGVSQFPLSFTPHFAVEHLREAGLLGPALFSAAISNPGWSERWPALQFSAIESSSSASIPATAQLGIGDRPSAPIGDVIGSPGPIEFGQGGWPETAATVSSNVPAPILLGTSPGVAPQGLSDVSIGLQSTLPTPTDDLAGSVEAAEIGLLNLAQAAERLSGTFALMRPLDASNARLPAFTTSPIVAPISERGIASSGNASGNASVAQLSRALQNLSIREENIANELKTLQPIEVLLSDIISESIPHIISSIDAESAVLSHIEKNTEKDIVDDFNKYGGAVATAITLGGAGGGAALKGYRWLQLARTAKGARAGEAAEGAAEAASGDAFADIGATEVGGTVAEGAAGGELGGFLGLELGLDASGIGLPAGLALALGAGGIWLVDKAAKDISAGRRKDQAYDVFLAAHSDPTKMAALSDQQLTLASDAQAEAETRWRSNWRSSSPKYSADNARMLEYDNALKAERDRRSRFQHPSAYSPPSANAGSPTAGPPDAATAAGLANLPVKSVKAITTAFDQLGQAIGHTGKLIQIIAPQFLAESAALNTSTAALAGPKGLAASARAAAAALDGFASLKAYVPTDCCSAPIQVMTKINLDGRTIATAVSKYQAHSLGGPRGSHLRPDKNLAFAPVGGVY